MNKHAVFPKYPPTLLYTYSLFQKKIESAPATYLSRPVPLESNIQNARGMTIDKKNIHKHNYTFDVTDISKWNHEGSSFLEQK